MAEQVALNHAQSRIGLLPATERRLARLAKAGDARAFALIYERYHQEIYRYCRAILRDPHEAQDALQSTMASALRSLPGETREIALRPWLYRVAHNQALSLIRRRREHGEVDERALPVVPGAGAHAETRERLRDLMNDLDALPERLRAALVMRELSGLRHEEIAAALDISPGAARQAVYEARAALLELSEGREMSCEEIRRLISDRDGRVLRGRRVRAHLRACSDCKDFRAAIQTRRADLRALAPPLPAAAATGILGGLAGGLGGTGAVVGAKGLSVVAATAAIGIGAAGLSGSVDLGGGSGDGSISGRADPAASGAGAKQAGPAAEATSSHSRDGRAGAGIRAERGRAGAASAYGRSQAGGRDQGPPADPPAAPQAAAPGASEAAPAGTGQPENPPGSDVASERSDGQSASPTPDHGASPPLPDSAGRGVAANESAQAPRHAGPRQPK